MSVTTADGRWAIPGRTLFESAIELISRFVAAPADASPEPDPEAVAFAAQAREVTRAAWDAPNPQKLRQHLGEIALAPAFAALTVDLNALGGDDGVRRLAALDLSRPLRLPPPIVKRLGAPTADLLVEALAMAGAIARWDVETESHAFEGAIEAMRTVGPEETSRLRHLAVLGDELPPSVAQVVLMSLRGEVAFLMLLALIIEDASIPEWKGVTLGESAVEGMAAAQRFLMPSVESIDLEQAAREHAAFKTSLFQRLDAPPAVDLFPDDDSDENDPKAS